MSEAHLKEVAFAYAQQVLAGNIDGGDIAVQAHDVEVFARRARMSGRVGLDVSIRNGSDGVEIPCSALGSVVAILDAVRAADTGTPLDPFKAVMIRRKELHKALFMAASNMQGEMSAGAAFVASTLGVDHPFNLDDLRTKARLEGFDPKDLWPWAAQ